jgi:hypothetical protein
MSIQRDVEQHLAAKSFFSMMFRNGARSATLKSVKRGEKGDSSN